MDRVVGLDGVRAEIAFLQTPEGHGRIELTKIHTPLTQTATGTRRRTRHVAFASKTSTPSSPACGARGPEEIIVELAEYIG